MEEMLEKSIGVFLAVILTVAIVGLIVYLAGRGFGLRIAVGKKGEGLLSFVSGSSQINVACRDFLDTRFSPDFDYEGRFQGVFPESSGELKYKKLKLLCGALIPIEDAVDGGKNLRGTLDEINDAYSFSYENLQFSYEEINAAIDDNEKTVWLGEVQNILEREIDAKVTE